MCFIIQLPAVENPSQRDVIRGVLAKSRIAAGIRSTVASLDLKRRTLYEAAAI
ncbi:MAG: hypothetical protein ACE5Z5_10235 [Candidatus Bathyarchaeia archaeon]